VLKCLNGLTERSGRLPFHAEVPERVDRKVREDAILSRAPGRMSRKAGNLRMETGCLHRKVGTGRQTQDVKSPPEYGWHSSAIRRHDRYDLTNTPFDSCRLKEWLESFFPPGFSR